MNKPLLIVLVLLASATTAHACIWDRDTLAMERAKFPGVNELIVGYFPRHSSAYYQWRKEQVLAISVDERSAADYDDLGASYDKLGEHDKAIQTMLDKIERFPTEGLYETHANLGTFYIHNGDLEQGVQYIGSAIEINPDAHFGREVYQKLLVEYVIQQRAKANTLPLEQALLDRFADVSPDSKGFGSFVLRQQGFAPDSEDYEVQMTEIERATKGILGMMRFGNHDSPILLEVLGDLLHQRVFDADAQRLAARAYLMASYEAEDPVAATIYRGKAMDAIGSQHNVSFADVEENLKEEIAISDVYFAKIEADERAWIEAGKDVDALFISTYYEEAPEYSQSLLSRARDRFNSVSEYKIIFYLVIVIGPICFISLIVLALRIRRMRSRQREIAARLQQA